MFNRIILNIKKLERFFKVFVLRDKFLLAHKKWVEDKGDSTFRMNYDLSLESIVFDLGGYEGALQMKYLINITVIFIYLRLLSSFMKICVKNFMKIKRLRFLILDYQIKIR
jgi:hypothetical protein